MYVCTGGGGLVCLPRSPPPHEPPHPLTPWHAACKVRIHAQARHSSSPGTGVLLEELVLTTAGAKVAYNRKDLSSVCMVRDAEAQLEVTAMGDSGESAFFPVATVLPGMASDRGTLLFRFAAGTVGSRSKLILHYGPPGMYAATTLVDLASAGRGDLASVRELSWWKTD